MAKTFDELIQRTMTPSMIADARRGAEELLKEILLKDVRKYLGKSQQEIAAAMGVKQPSLSKLEKQRDMQISTLVKIVAAMGGELQITAKFRDLTVTLDQFTKPRRTRKPAAGKAPRT